MPEPAAGDGFPSVALKRPPASVTTMAGAATSHSDSSGSAAMSTAPSATSMCDQKSPYARVRQQARESARKPSSLPYSSHEITDEYANDASLSSLTCDTCNLVALARDRPVYAPDPREAHQRRPRAGAETTPATGSPSSISAIRVAQTGTPRT